MKSLCPPAAILGPLLSLSFSVCTGLAQDAAFSYQGKLNSNNAPANGSFDLTFALFASSNGVGQVGGTLTNLNTGVTNGLFAVTLDFGPGVFTGANLWLQMGVRTNGGTTFTTLEPLQPIMPVPYALFANTASNLLGALPAAQLSGTLPLTQLPSGLLTNNQTGVSFNGALTTTNLSAGTAPNLWVLGSSGGTAGGNITLASGNAGIPTGGSGGNLNLQAGNAMAAGGGGYSGLGPAGSVNITAGSGYNSVGGNVTLQSGGNSPWDLTPNLFSKVSLLGGVMNPGDNAQLDVESGHNTTYGSPPQNSAGGNVRIIGGSSTTGFGGGNILLLPGTGSPNGFVGIGKTNPATLLDVNGTVAATGFVGNGAGLTVLNYNSITNPPALPTVANLVATNDTRALRLTNAANQFVGSYAGSLSGATNLTLAGLQSGGAANGQILAWNGTSWAPSNAPAGGGSAGGLATSGGSGTNEVFYGTTAFNGPVTATNINATGPNLWLLGSAGSSVGGNITVASGSAAVATGGSGGNLNLQAGNAMAMGGSGYYGLGPAGAVSITAGNGYNSVGGNVVLQSGGNSPWSTTVNACSKVSLQGIGFNTGDGATVDVEGGRNISSSGSSASSGGNVRIAAGNGSGGSAGGNIVLLPGTGSPSGNLGIGTSAPAYPLTMASGAYCSAAGVWTSVSDRNVKEDFTSIAPVAVLEKVLALPITQWKYKAEPKGTKHIGPVAQDFHAAFGLGDSDKAIGSVDEDGVALAAIQGLNQKLEEQKAENARLKARLEKLEQFLNAKTTETK